MQRANLPSSLFATLRPWCWGLHFHRALRTRSGSKVALTDHPATVRSRVQGSWVIQGVKRAETTCTTPRRASPNVTHSPDLTAYLVCWGSHRLVTAPWTILFLALVRSATCPWCLADARLPQPPCTPSTNNSSLMSHLHLVGGLVASGPANSMGPSACSSTASPTRFRGAQV